LNNKLPFNKVIIYGAGNIGKDVYGLASAFGMDIVAFVDKSNEKQHEGYVQLPVWSIEELSAIDLSDITVIIGILNIEVVQQVLTELEVKCGFIYRKNMYFYEDFFKQLVKDMTDEMYYKTLYKGYYGDNLSLDECSIESGNDLYGINTLSTRSPNVILSLTSYPKRFSTLHLCIKSLLNQSYKPDKIVLYLTQDEIKSLNAYNKIIIQKRFGLTITEVDEDLRQHKKYYYAMKEHPNDIIITVDDDAIYHKDLVKNLMKSYEQHPKCMSAPVAKKIFVKSDGELALYENWDNQYEPLDEPSMSLMAIGVGGKLHPPHSLHDDALNKELMKKMCFSSEDFWVKSMEVLAGTKVAFVSEYNGKLPGAIFDTQETAVWKHWDEHSGTKQKLLEDILQEYGLPLSVLSGGDE